MTAEQIDCAGAWQTLALGMEQMKKRIIKWTLEEDKQCSR